MAFNNNFKSNRNIPNLVIRDVEILNGTSFRNFSGEKGRYNDKGEKQFVIAIPDPNVGEQLIEDGWKVKILQPRNDGDEPKYILRVAINFNFWQQPIVNMRCDGVTTALDDETIGMLDTARIIRADVSIRAREWEPGSIKAYLDELLVEIEPFRKSLFLDEYAEEEAPEEAPWE